MQLKAAVAASASLLAMSGVHAEKLSKADVFVNVVQCKNVFKEGVRAAGCHKISPELGHAQLVWVRIIDNNNYTNSDSSQNSPLAGAVRIHGDR
jgi:hypothetical protein